MLPTLTLSNVTAAWRLVKQDFLLLVKPDDNKSSLFGWNLQLSPNIGFIRSLKKLASYQRCIIDELEGI